jgi:hypothetical protein
VTRRLLVAASLALAAAGTLGATAATADTTPALQTSSGGPSIACAGVRTINVAVCVEEPVGPILDRLPR